MTNNHSNLLLEELKKPFAKVRRVAKYLTLHADINVQSPGNGYTPLMLAVANENIRIMEYLLRYGADPLIGNHDGLIASQLVSHDLFLFGTLKDHELIFATLYNDTDLINTVIEAGAFIDKQGFGGYTPLMIAAENGNTELVEFYLMQGADITLTLQDGRGIDELASNIDVAVTIENYRRLMKDADKAPINDAIHAHKKSRNTLFFNE